MDHTLSKDTSRILKEDNPRTVSMKRKKKKKPINGLRSSEATEDTTQANVTASSPGDKPSPKITSNEDRETQVPAKATVPSNTAKPGNTELDVRNNGASQRSKYSSVNYEFHEVNHAIIDTFGVSLALLLRDDNRKGRCLICDTTLHMQYDEVRKSLCKHIRSKKHVQLLTTMIEDHRRSVNDGDAFSKLALSRECMITDDDAVKCLLCDIRGLCCKVTKTKRSLGEHITSRAHREAKESWEPPVRNVLQYIHSRFRSPYNARNYRCEFCNYQSPSECYFVKHLHVPYHVTRLTEMPDHADRFKFYFCGVCLTLWFGSADTSDQHYQQIEHKHSIMYGAEVNDLPERMLPFLAMFKQNAEMLLRRSNRVCQDEMMKRSVLHSFESDLRKYIPNVRAYAFGSRVSELGFPESDIDVFLDCNNTYEGKNSSYRQSQSLIASVVQYLSQNRKLWFVDNVILHSRTPIAKVRHIPSGVICDISVTNGLAVENTKIIKCYNHAFPLCRKLILFLKQWLHLSDLLGSHLITSYALTWCVIFYLQNVLVLPCISDLIKLKNRSRLISGWEVGVSHDVRIVNGLDRTFEELLLGFFLFYADFGYKNQVICPLLGQPIQKSAFIKLSDLPREMVPYIVYMDATNAQEDPPQAFSVSPLCVQDPFDLSHNLTKAVNNRELKTFRNNCTVSAKVLTTALPNLKPPLLPYSD